MYKGVPLGVFLGSIATDWIDYGWENIDWSKAIFSGAISWGVGLFLGMLGEALNKYNIYNLAIYFINAYNTIFTSITNSIVNIFWMGKNNGKSIS